MQLHSGRTRLVLAVLILAFISCIVLLKLLNVNCQAGLEGLGSNLPNLQGEQYPLKSSCATGNSLGSEQATKQKFFCAIVNEMQPDDTQGGKLIPTRLSMAGQDFVMYVFSGQDLVSQSILEAGPWDAAKTGILLSVLKAEAIRQQHPVSFVDIGANLGWFSLAVAAHGHTVYAFEPMQQNGIAFRRSMCSNPNFTEVITYYDVGLGSTPHSKCFVFSDTNVNKGDGHMSCDPNFTPPDGYHVASGGFETGRLDYYLPQAGNIALVKMDVEGFECHVLEGGRNLLLHSRIPYIVTEFSVALLSGKGCDPHAFLEAFHTAGYVAHLDDFTGDILPLNRTQNLSMLADITDIYFTYGVL